MTLTLSSSFTPYGTLTIGRYQGIPVGWDETDTSKGLAARRFPVVALLSPAEWLLLADLFEDWKAARVSDAPTLSSESIGSTVTFSGTIGDLTWSNVPCWFIGAPQPEEAGVFIRASFELVDAEQQLAVLLAAQEQQTAEADASTPTYGTLSVGGVTVTLTKRPEGFTGGSSLEATATGTDVVRGGLSPRRIRDVEGYFTSSSDVTTLESWYLSTSAVRPASGDWFPVTPPDIQAEKIVANGVTTTRYNLKITLQEAR